jgi:hypothetical protein
MCTQLGRHTLNLHDPWTQPTGSLCALSIGDVCNRLSVQVCLATWGRFFACRVLNLDRAASLITVVRKVERALVSFCRGRAWRG